jgi:hypothetical protein
MRKQLLVSEMEKARALVSEHVVYTRDEVMEWNVTVMTLMQGMDSEQVCDGTGCGSCAFSLPSDGGRVVGEIMDGVRADVDGLGEDVKLGDGGGEFQFAVGNVAVGV